eukprot:CAMPEP_0197178832 /NCGR_PEP_ID=MMETSP1423-20130617/3985_1 /TAXON_ID=476441 /ORGANISM="Pseudo-nitzschia heimii, Strain UNC1101" /LENGTH=534 /DNA_ID=CAMNT_0042628645 /DNA_START=270 /DNA_END=1874 /DNA_ORIENTATION=+
MKVFLLLILAQLIYLARGYSDGLEFGRGRADENNLRRVELMIINNLEGKRQVRKKKQFNWEIEESFSDFYRATLEFSTAFSLSMSMSGPVFPSTPSPPSGPPNVATASPDSPSPLGPSEVTPGPPSIPTGETNNPAPSEPSGSSDDPRPMESPVSPPSPSNTPGSPVAPGSPSIPTGQTKIPAPSEHPGPTETPVSPPSPSNAPGSPSIPTGQTKVPAPLEPSWSSGDPVSPLPSTALPLIPSLPPIFSVPITTTDPADPPHTLASSVSPVPSPIVQPQPTTANNPSSTSTSSTSQPSTEPPSSGPPTGTSDCRSTNTFVLGTAADESSTPIALDMSYTAESNNSAVEDFEDELVGELIRTAAFAIFGCDPEIGGKIAANTEEIIEATCDPTVDDGNECFVLQTTFIVGVEGPVDTDVAAYEAYKAIEERMADGTYAKAVPDVVFLEFLSPLPLLQPPGGGGGGGANAVDGVEDPDFQRDVDVSPWTIGFSVASVMGGFVSLLVYARAKRSRQNRLGRLDETTPWVSEGGETVV